jgi:hypothetical protein
MPIVGLYLGGLSFAELSVACLPALRIGMASGGIGGTPPPRLSAKAVTWIVKTKTGAR